MSEQSPSRKELLDQLCEILSRLRDLESESRAEQEKLREYQDIFEKLFQHKRKGIVILQDWKIVRANSRMAELLGVNPADIVGRDAKQYLQAESLSEASRRYEEKLSGKLPFNAERDHLVKADGVAITVQIDAARITFLGKESLLAIVTDLTYILKAEAELLRFRQYETTLLEQVSVWVNVLDQSGNVVVWNKAAEEISGYLEEEVIGRSQIWEDLYPDVAYRKQIYSKAMRIIQKGEVARAFETNIVTRDQKRKTISWYSRNMFDDQNKPMGSIAIGLDVTDIRNANDALEQSNMALAHAYDQTIEGWSKAMDLRDKETEGHSERVTETTLALAKMAGIDGEELTYIRWGSLLHDIGKLGVPDSILLKPGELSEDELAQMRQHTKLAYTMLQQIEYLKPALDIPRYHHEKWDGTGYPNGLKGEEIPLPARLFAVADIWDALRSDRPYRKAWTEKEALKYIKSIAGTHLDPAVVKYFLKYQSANNKRKKISN